MLINAIVIWKGYFSGASIPWYTLPKKKSWGLIEVSTTRPPYPTRPETQERQEHIEDSKTVKSKQTKPAKSNLCSFKSVFSKFPWHHRALLSVRNPWTFLWTIRKHWSRGKPQLRSIAGNSRPEFPTYIFHLYFLPSILIGHHTDSALHPHSHTTQYTVPHFPLSPHSSQIPDIISFLLLTCHKSLISPTNRYHSLPWNLNTYRLHYLFGTLSNSTWRSLYWLCSA